MYNIQKLPFAPAGIIAQFNEIENPTEEQKQRFENNLSYHGYKVEGEEVVQCTPTRDAHEIKRDAYQWVERSFNFIQLEHLQTIIGADSFHECIRPKADDICAEHVWIEYLDEDDKKEVVFECSALLNDESKVFKALMLKVNETNFEDLPSLINCEEDEFFQAIREQNEDAYWDKMHGDDNYPMWNTCFEFKENVSQEIVQAAINAGFGVIEHEDFNPILFVSGAGYSFYSSHWIPLYLQLPWVDVKVTEDYSGM